MGKSPQEKLRMHQKLIVRSLLNSPFDWSLAFDQALKEVAMAIPGQNIDENAVSVHRHTVNHSC